MNDRSQHAIRAAVLARVSSDEQVKGTSLDTQVEDCRRKAIDEGYFVSDEDVFVEKGISGALPAENRPALGAILDLIDRGYYQALICYSPDRLSRDAVYQLLYEKEAKNKGCPVIYVAESYDDSPEGELMKTFRAGISQYERALIRRRTMRGRRKTLSNGHFGGGRVPFGYVWAKDVGWTFDEAKADVVRGTYHSYVRRGMSFREITKSLNESHAQPPQAPDGGRWSTSTVRHILCNPGYVGFQYGMRGKSASTVVVNSLAALEALAEEKDWVRVSGFPAVLTDADGTPDTALWEAAQKKRVSNRREPTGPRALKWPLQGRLRCGECGRQMRCRTNTNRFGKRVYYCHPRENPTRRCQTPRLTADDAERAVANALGIALADSEKLKTAVGKYLDEVHVNITELTNRMRPVEGDNEDLDTEFERAKRLFVKGHLTENQFDDTIRPIQERRARLDELRSQYEPVLTEIKGFESELKSINLAMEDGSLMARVSRLQGLKLLRERSSEEIVLLRRASRNRSHGVQGIDRLRLEPLAGDSGFRETLNLLNVRIVVDRKWFGLEGAIPLDLPVERVIDFDSGPKAQKRFRQVSSSGRVDTPPQRPHLGFDRDPGAIPSAPCARARVRA
jgi:site-specific DNA recombinase